MTPKAPSDRGFSKLMAIILLGIAVVAVAFLFDRAALVQPIREFFMQRVTSAHYEIRCPQGALSQGAMTEFASNREPLFESLNKKLRGADSNTEIRIVLDPNFPVPPSSDPAQQLYAVAGTAIRTKLNGKNPRLPSAADAEALLYAAWGAPGNAQVARWVANWLVGDWRGAEIGMAAALVEQRLGHKNVESLLVDPGGEIASPDDRTLLGAAWISEIAEFGGTEAVRRLYATKMPHPTAADVAKAMNTTPQELDRKWQLWIYAYLAGMPSPASDSSMPMNMPMGNTK
jgi:hypothetical protein